MVECSVMRANYCTGTYGTHQLQLKWDSLGTRMFLSHTCNYTHYQLPSCLGLHAYQEVCGDLPLPGHMANFAAGMTCLHMFSIVILKIT